MKKIQRVEGRVMVSVKVRQGVCFVQSGEEGRSNQVAISQGSTANGLIAEVVEVAGEVSI